MRHWMRLLMVLAIAMFGAASCGDDGGGGGDLNAYCDLVAELDEIDDIPSDDQLDELATLAPDEISDEVDLVTDRFKDANDDPASALELFEDEEIVEAFAAIEAFEAENCDGEG